jgi:hypothetical protein
MRRAEVECERPQVRGSQWTTGRVLRSTRHVHALNLVAVSVFHVVPRSACTTVPARRMSRLLEDRTAMPDVNT